MTDQMNGQVLLPGLAGVTALPAADTPRHCRQPGCGNELPAATGRGAPRVFCSPACSRKWHNDNRLAAATTAPRQAAADSGPLAGLTQLLAQAAELAGAAAAQLAGADPGRVTAALAAADAARRPPPGPGRDRRGPGPGSGGRPGSTGSHHGDVRRPR
jgi:hypothetical protein